MKEICRNSMSHPNIINIFSMTTLSDQERRAYEAYLLAPSEDLRQEAITRLVPGSPIYYHLYFLDRFRLKGGQPLSTEEQSLWDQFKRQYPHSQEFKEIEARYRLLQYDESDNEEARSKILADINKQYFNLTFEHYKPEDFQRQGESSSQSEASDAEDGSSEPAFGEMRKTSELDYDRYFSKAKLTEQHPFSVTNEHESNQALKKLPSGFEHEIDFTKYHPRSVYSSYSQKHVLGKRLSDLQNPTFFESLKAFFAEEYKTNQHFELSQDFCDLLTLQQLDLVSTLHPNIKGDIVFIGSYFQKQFAEELSKENQEVWSSEEKRHNLLTLYKYTQSKNMPKTLQAALLIEVLDLGIRVGVYDERLFRDYLKIPLAFQTHIFKNKSLAPYNEPKKEAARWNRYIDNVQQSQKPAASAPSGNVSWDTTQTEMIRKYLEHFCLQKGSLEAFKEDFEKAYLRSIEERVAIYNAEAAEGLTKLNLDGSGDILKKYHAVSSETIVRFVESNADQFKVDEEVLLVLELKNVQTLYLKIFEFNTETYYKKTLQPFNTSVNLDGLVASTERTVEDFKDRPANKKYIEAFRFPELTGKVGLFIVEFIGNGLSARAVIKKGSLSFIHKPTVAGHLAYVLDENKKICTGEEGNTGVYFDGQYFQARPDQGGKIFIPYGKSSTVAKAILLHKGFAQLCDFERQTEQYTFSAWIHVNSESILIGNKASVLIKPNLQINTRMASLDLLKDAKVVLTTTSYIDSIPITKTFENIKFQDGRDCVLDFQVPAYLQNISVSLECEVFNITQQSKQKFSASRNFTINSYCHSHNMCELFLKKEAGAHFVYVLGKNGEPRPDVNLQLKVMHKWFGDRTKEIVLTTDKEGKVALGRLKKVMGVHVEARFLNLSQTWLIGNQAGEGGSNNLLTYPSQVDVIEGETLEFPVATLNKKTRKNVSLIKLWSPQGSSSVSVSSGNRIVIEDLFERIKVEKGDADYSLLKLEGLQEGTYKLNIKKLSKSILITVHKGQYWDNDSFILKRNCLFENRAPLKMIKVANVTVTDDVTTNKQNVVIRTEDFSSSARIHVFASHYLPQCSSMMFMSNAKLLSSSGAQNKTVFPFAQWKNILLSNRELSDEFRYVFDRKYAERYLGNTLDKPKLLLKRNFVQTTTVEEEVLRTGQQYAQQNMGQEIQQQSQMIQPRMQQQMVQERAYDRRMMMNNCMPRSQNIQQAAYDDCDFVGGSGGRYDEEAEYGYDMMMNRMSESDSELSSIPEIQNFLKTPPLAIFNLVPSADKGEITFQANLKPFTQLYVLAIDLNSVAQRQIDLAQASATQKRDLSLAQSLQSGQEDKGFNESRTTIELAKDETHFIEDITSSEIQLIDDMKKVKGVLEELMRVNYHTQSGVFKELSGIVMKWHKLSAEEKHKQYYKNLCHELNFFIKSKDQLYFSTIVRPLLECKMEKTFVDYYLLEDYARIVKTYYSLERLNYMNAFEKCLLVDSLIKEGREADARKIAEHIKIMKEALEQIDIETQNKTFDIVLNLNMLKADDDVLNRMLLEGGVAECAYDLLGDAQQECFMIQSSNAGPYNQMASMSQMMPMMNQSNTLFAGGLGGGGVFGGAAPGGGGSLFGASNAPRPLEAMYLNSIQPSAYTATSTLFPQQQYGRPPPQERMMMKNSMMATQDPFSQNSADIMGEYNDSKKKVRMAFEEIQTTGEYMETHYFKQRSYADSRHLIPISSFWHDYVQYLLQKKGGKQSFLSANFCRNESYPTAAILTFALLDLPQEEAAAHAYKQSEVGRGVELRAANNLILFKKEVKEAPLDITNDILVTHRYVSAAGDFSTTSAIPEEFLVNKAYACEVIMTNVSPQQKTFSVLYQIPQGSLPLQMTKYMKSVQQSLSPYTTSKMIFYFYFPKEGDFTHFPSNVSAEQKIIARATQSNGGALTLKVVKKLSVAKKETFNDVMQSASRNEDVLEFLRTQNLVKGDKGFSFYTMLWMLRDKVFWKKVVAVLRERLIYDDGVWSYSLLHKEDETAIREYITQNRNFNFIQALGHTVKSKLFDLTLEDSEFKHLDYFPMVNARAHLVGELENWTLNKNFKNTYTTFLRAMAQHSSTHKQATTLSDPTHKMMLVQYFQLQDRVTEAINIFKTIKLEDLPKDGSLRIQHDYLSAYFDFFTGQDEGFKVARTIVRRYEDYPITAWRIPFLEILDQLNEYDGEVDEEVELGDDPENLTEEQKKLKYKQSIKKEPSLSCEFSEKDASLLLIDAANIKQVSVKFYIIDAEILFSRTPFLKTNTEEFSYVKPCEVITKDMAAEEQKLEIAVPEKLVLQNMVIEITGEGKQLFRTYYATQIKVQLTEAYGELKVTEKEGGKALPKVYVKVFAQKKGGSTATPFFFKDGYTDIRGKFDYAQTSGNRLKDVQRFAILVMSDTLGSIIKEVDPPKNAGGEADEVGGLAQGKADRLMNRITTNKAKCSMK